VKVTVAQRLGNEFVLSDDDRSTRFWAQVGWSFQAAGATPRCERACG
jgi:hypothetical protein